ncbi:unnamed protein product [Brassicogethes aeneus]|uniref:Uncharacterized protein n=1 Tax=Brassicogethes aeneus TaxID=1431903 RepID=A0A9P0B1D3_BRAAE|nr:unnamed protein product [Brassicogethes aeneus]
MFLKSFVPYFLGVTLVMCFDSWMWISTVGWDWFQYYIARDIKYAQMCIMMYLMFTLGRVIQSRFNALNRMLKKVVHSIVQNENETNGSGTYLSTKPDLKTLSKSYNDLCELVDLYNFLFGVIIVCVALSTIAILLNNAVLAINYSFNKDDMDGIGFGLNLLALCLVWAIICLVYSSLNTTQITRGQNQRCFALNLIHSKILLSTECEVARNYLQKLAYADSRQCYQDLYVEKMKNVPEVVMDYFKKNWEPIRNE